VSTPAKTHEHYCHEHGYWKHKATSCTGKPFEMACARCARKFRKEAKGKNPMSKKKAKKKRNRPRRGVMPPALKAYWAKKRKKKKTRPLKRAKAILLSELRRAGYAIVSKPNRRRRKKANPRNGVNLYAVYERIPGMGREWHQVNEVEAKSGAAAIRATRAEDSKRGNKPPSGTKYKALTTPNRRRRKKANPRKKMPRSIRIPGTVTPKQKKAIGRFLARATGLRVVHKRAGRK
jgi:hypothetical protein